VFNVIQFVRQSPRNVEESLVQTDAVLAHIIYQHVAEAIVWLSKTFGFTKPTAIASLEDRSAASQMHLSDACHAQKGATRLREVEPTRLRKSSPGRLVGDVNPTSAERISGRENRGGSEREILRSNRELEHPYVTRTSKHRKGPVKDWETVGSLALICT
jgi:hypothetical protein